MAFRSLYNALFLVGIQGHICLGSLSRQDMTLCILGHAMTLILQEKCRKILAIYPGETMLPFLVIKNVQLVFLSHPSP